MKEGPIKKEQVVKLIKDGINILSKLVNLDFNWNFRQGTKLNEDW